jgi:hypothetical protein
MRTASHRIVSGRRGVRFGGAGFATRSSGTGFAANLGGEGLASGLGSEGLVSGRVSMGLAMDLSGKPSSQAFAGIGMLRRPTSERSYTFGSPTLFGLSGST